MPDKKEPNKKDKTVALAPQDLADRFLSFRKLNKLSQKDMASLLGISQSGIVEYESAKRSIPVETLQILHAHYKMSYEWFFTGKGKPDEGSQIDEEETDVKKLRDDVRILKLKILKMDKQMIGLVRELYDIKHKTSN